MTVQIPKVHYCARCVYPSSSAVSLVFDKNGVCSGCRVHDQRKEIDWDERLKMLLELVEPYRKPSGYECVIGVSGGKDSYFQAHFVTQKLGLKPLLVTYDGNNFLDVGWRNLLRMKELFNTDHVIFRPSVDLLVRLNRLAFRKMGDMNWHAHAGIGSTVMMTAVRYSIPLVFWGEHGYTDLGGMYSMYDLVEYTARYRRDHQMRGYDWNDMLGDAEDPIQENEMQWCLYPSDEDIARIGLRGVYIGNYDPWDANAHSQLVVDKYGWEPSPVPFDRTYRRFSNLDDRYENGAHDYLKFIKFGYGRATDHSCKDIRRGHMTREQGIEMVRRYDHVRPSDLDFWLNYVDRSEDWFWGIADTFRSPKVWAKDGRTWIKQNIWDQLRG
jgi:N-acetyl sugar amidotransferase